MSKVKNFLEALIIISIIGLVWCTIVVISLASVAMAIPTILNMLI